MTTVPAGPLLGARDALFGHQPDRQVVVADIDPIDAETGRHQRGLGFFVASSDHVGKLDQCARAGPRTAVMGLSGSLGLGQQQARTWILLEHHVLVDVVAFGEFDRHV